jgi:hypothetical protein
MQRSDQKNLQLTNDIKDMSIDCFGAAEVNLAWQNLPYVDQLQERFRGMFEFAKFISANNRDSQFKERKQSGGTMMTANGNMCARIINSTSDPRKLGRWCSLLFRGKNGLKVRVITVYRAVHSKGSLSAYQQQKNVLLDNEIDTCPRAQLFVDLQEFLSKCNEAGEQIIVMGDFNEDIRNRSITTFFEDMGMRELLLDLHGTNAPNTYIDGVHPIDGVFGTQNIQILAGGYTDFTGGIKTDHRMLWIDLRTASVLGTDEIPLWKPLARRLKCNDPRLVDRFNHLRKVHAEQNSLKQKIAEVRLIIDRLPTVLSPEITAALEEIDVLRTKGILWADKHCRKLKMGQVPWSPAIQQCMNRIKYYNACRLKLEYGRNVNSRTLATLYSKTTLTEKALTIDETKIGLKNTFNQYNLLKSKATQLRSTFLEELALAISIQGNGNKEKILQQLQLHEEQRAVARKIKSILGQHRSGVSAVEYQNAQGGWEVTVEKHKIEEECMQENIRRFTQANNSPSLKQDQVELLGWTADTETASLILQGEQTPTALDQAISRLAPFLKTPDGMTPISTNITRDEYNYYWTRCREYTSTGTSGLHFGHFLASSRDLEIGEIDRWVLETNFHHSFIPHRWKHGIDVMIPKKVGSLRASQLRTIVLMEPDFNFINKIFGRRLMRNAEKYGTVAPEQFGSRKNKSAIIHAVNKQLTVDILRQDHRIFILVLLDAKSCYDRISPPLASLCLQRQGAPQQCVALMFTTIQDMQHFIRTTYGDSDSPYYSDENIKFHGILQGNGAGPTIWALVSSPLLDRLRVKKCGVALIETDGTILQIPAFAFVDDVDLLQELQKGEDINDAQRAVDEWGDGLRATGGELVPNKCKWFLVQPQWDNNKWGYNRSLQSGQKLFLPNERGDREEIEQCSVDSGQLALGIAFSPIADSKDEVKRLLGKVSTWVENVRTGHLTRQEAWQCLQTTVMKTIGYCLPASILSKKDIDDIMTPLLKIGLPKAGICRTMARAVVYGSVQVQGLGVQYPFWMQGIEKIKLLLDMSQTTTQRLLDIAWCKMVIESGLGPTFWDFPFKKMQRIVTKGWLSTLWEFISEADGLKIRRMDGLRHRYPRFDGDQYLMQLLIQQQNISGEDIKAFNYCRLFLQVEMMSDILTADGKMVRKDLWMGKKNDSPPLEQDQWPQQPRPTDTLWKRWRSLLQRIMDTDSNGKIRSCRPNCISRTADWPWVYDETTDRLYQQSRHTILEYSSHREGRSPRTRQKKFRLRGNVESVPVSGAAVTVYTSGINVHIDGYGDKEHNDHHEDDNCRNIHHFIQTSQAGDDSAFLSALMNGDMMIMSDGSAKANLGAAAWIITSEKDFGNNIAITGSVKLPHGKADSYRAECYGIYGGLWSIQQLIHRVHISKEQMSHLHIQMGCDNISALNYCLDTNKIPILNGRESDFDIVGAVRSLLTDLPSITWRHVKGHQSGDDLDIWAQLNNRVDVIAGEARESTSLEIPPSTTLLPGEKWQIHLADQKIYKHLTPQIYDHMSRAKIFPYWVKKDRFSADGIHKVHWEALGATMRQASSKQRQWITKRASRECGANQVLHKRKAKLTDKCTLCDGIETVLHVLQCPDARAQQQWELAIQDFRDWLTNYPTDPDIINKICSGLVQWRQSGRVLPTSCEDVLTMHQNLIGWNGLLEGGFHSDWSTAQQAYFEVHSSRRTGFKWQVAVCRRIWQIPWSMWKHRNDIEHANDLQKDMIQTDTAIQEELERGSDNREELENLLQAGRQLDQEKKSLAYKKGWLRGVRALRQRLQRRGLSDRILQGMRANMRTFLQQ